MVVKGTVTRLMDFGAFVELEPGIEGLVHITELSPSRVTPRVGHRQAEQEVEVRILKIGGRGQEDLALLRPPPITPVAEEVEEEEETPAARNLPAKVPLRGGMGGSVDRRRGSVLRLTPRK